jgi:hypothetical protein
MHLPSGGSPATEYLEVRLHIPYTGTQQSFRYRPSTMPGQPPEAAVADGAVMFAIPAGNMDVPVIEQRLLEQERNLVAWVGAVNADLQALERQVRSLVTSGLQQRRALLTRRDQLAAAMTIPAVQPPATGRPLVHLAGYAAPTLLTYAGSPVPFVTLITEWFALCERLPTAVALLCGPYYAPFIYSQHSYASTFQSAEAIATYLLAGREKLPSEHGARVAAVKAVLQVADLDADTVGWAMRILQGRNDKPLRQLLEELIAATGDMGSQLLAALSDLPQRAADVRVGVSHPRDGRPATLERYWIGEALIWVVRVHLLAQLGVAMTDLSGRVTAKPMFERIVQELRSLVGEEAGAAEPATSQDGASPAEQGEVVTPPAG